MLIWQTISTGSDDTQALGELLASLVKPPLLIELVADLGGGKTTFVKGLARGLKSENEVTSPSFTLNRIYKCAGGKQIHHFDFYRLPEAGIMTEQVSESLQNEDALTVVEWSDVVKDVFPKDHLTIEFKPTAINPDEREITISYPDKLADTVRSLEQKWGRSQP